MIARLKPGATLAQAQSQIDTAECHVGGRRPPGQNDGRCGLSFPSGATARRPRRGDPSHSTVAASRRAGSSLNRRRQPCEPASHPCQWPSQGIGRPAGAGREPATRGERSRGRDHLCSRWPEGYSGSLSGRAESVCWACWVLIACPWEAASPSTRDWHWSPCSQPSSWASSSQRQSPGSIFDVTLSSALQSESRGGTSGPRRSNPAP